MYYSGTKVDWSKIKIDATNKNILKAKVHYDSSEDISGTCGENVTWVLTSDGTLTISGSGDMYDYDMEGSWGDYRQTPWYGYREEIKNVVIEHGITDIGMDAFLQCANLSNVSIPDSVETIKHVAFGGCTGLKNIELPESITGIYAGAFSGSGLTSFTIPQGVTEIIENVFYNCTDLNSIVIHKSVTEIEENVFYGCNSLKDVYYNGTRTDWDKIQIDPSNGVLDRANIHYETVRLLALRVTIQGCETFGEFTEEAYGVSFSMNEYAAKAQSIRLPIAVDAEGEGGQWVPSVGVTYQSSDTSVAFVDDDGYLVIPQNASGQCVIQIQCTDQKNLETQLQVNLQDRAPRLKNTQLTMDSNRNDGVSIDIIERYDNGILEVVPSDVRFRTVLMWNGVWSIFTEEPVKNGTYSVSLSVRCRDGSQYTYPLTIKVTNTLPKPTVKQNAKLNLFYKNSTAPLTVTVPGQTVENVELTDTEDFAIELSENGWEIVYTTENPKPDTKGTLNVYLEGYRESAKVALTVGTVSTAPTVKLSAASSTVNSGSELTTQVRLLDKSGQPLELEDPAVESDNADVSIDGNLLTITLDEAKSTTVTLYLQDSTWAKSIKLTHKVTVSNKKPTLKPAGSLTLSSLFTARTAETAMVLSQSNLGLADVDFVSTAKEGSAVWTEAQKLELAYDGGYVTAQIVDADNAPKAGTYSFTCTGTLETGESIPGGTLKVTVSAAAPKVKLSATSVKLNKFLAGEEQGTVTVTAPSGYQVADFEGMCEGMAFDEDTGILTVTLENASDNGGNYTLYPVVRDVETGEEVELPTKLSFKVQAYNSNKLSVSLSAKGKLDTQKDSEILYTVTKLTNCLGMVDCVTLEGRDAELFRDEMDFVNGKTVIHLTLRDGKTYTTNKSYKVQFRLTACGKEILSPVQTVKVAQTALKLTPQKNITYYLGQTEPLRVTLTASVPIEWMNLGTKTDRDFLKALDWISWEENSLAWDYNGTDYRAEFWIPTPGALTEGKSYTVYLDALPYNNAENVSPVTIKLTVKVQK